MIFNLNELNGHLGSCKQIIIFLFSVKLLDSWTWSRIYSPMLNKSIWMRIHQINFNLYCALKILVNSCQILRQNYEIFLLKEHMCFNRLAFCLNIDLKKVKTNIRNLTTKTKNLMEQNRQHRHAITLSLITEWYK